MKVFIYKRVFRRPLGAGLVVLPKTGGFCPRLLSTGPSGLNRTMSIRNK